MVGTPRRFVLRGAAGGTLAAPCGHLGVTRERGAGRAAARLAPERALRGAGATRGRRALAALTRAGRGDGAATGARRGLALRGRRQRHAGAAGLRQADGDGLLRRTGAVLALAHVMDLLAHELPGLGAGTLALASGPLERSLLRHSAPPGPGGCESCASAYAFFSLSPCGTA